MDKGTTVLVLVCLVGCGDAAATRWAPDASSWTPDATPWNPVGDAYVPDVALTPDAEVTPDAGHVEDGGAPDAGSAPDAEADAETFLCSVFPQDGCPEGEACRYQVDGWSIVGTACERAGDVGDGGMCEVWEDGDSCLPGYYCAGNTCRMHCATDADCPGSRRCSATELFRYSCSYW
jgi:hypothetical protein